MATVPITADTEEVVMSVTANPRRTVTAITTNSRKDDTLVTANLTAITQNPLYPQRLTEPQMTSP